jgi:hypothetical protein
MTNDEVQAADSISRYFEQRFTEARDSWVSRSSGEIASLTSTTGKIDKVFSCI